LSAWGLSFEAAAERFAELRRQAATRDVMAELAGLRNELASAAPPAGIGLPPDQAEALSLKAASLRAGLALGDLGLPADLDPILHEFARQLGQRVLSQRLNHEIREFFLGYTESARSVQGLLEKERQEAVLLEARAAALRQYLDLMSALTGGDEIAAKEDL
jgi:hypothetical protein